MWRTARESVCLICRSAATPRKAVLEPIQPGISQRNYATRSQERRPSRMVLSDRVAREPSRYKKEGEGDSRFRKPQNRQEGPFGGMNRTVANVDRSRTSPARDSRDRDSDSRDKDDRDKGKEGAHRDYKALKMQRALATVPYHQRMAVKSRIEEIESFDQFDLVPEIKEAVYNDVLKGMVDIKPTPVQRLAISAMLGKPLGERRIRKLAGDELKREEFLLAAETGSGKTLAYLLPCIHHLRVSEKEDVDVQNYNKRLEAEKERRNGQPVSEWLDNFEPHPNTARPRVIVLVPTNELVEQVLNTAKSISHLAKFKVRPLSANYNPAKIQRNLYSPGGVDMIIATPHILAKIAERDPNILSRVSHLVIDEADSLFDRSFSPETGKIVDRALPSVRQLVLCSATIPRRLDNYLDAHFPNITRVVTPRLHAIPRRVQLGVIDVAKDPYRGNKPLACADAIWSIGKDASEHEDLDADEMDVKRIMVFVNERETAQEVTEYLVSKGIDAVALHRDTSDQRQEEALAVFTTPEPLKVSKAEAEEQRKATIGLRKRHLPNTKVIVATDLASRGIDTVAVRYVVLYDVPHTTIDFIHRLGRAGRMNRRGRGIVLVGKNDRRDIVREVKESMFRGQALI
ncbi:P-loop containing nucleoside triphosphate hydrolase protein [Podospora australis]|uniref:RNA helicase n=1 Tax=Podospora australis TaxID=1536484 RepID=A0AAN6WSE2_9PEZI|nr:P-loop containing nucleoside triphosphate hydrolase protein [Podospora australis]